jgi:hypothetical protein
MAFSPTGLALAGHGLTVCGTSFPFFWCIVAALYHLAAPDEFLRGRKKSEKDNYWL